MRDAVHLMIRGPRTLLDLKPIFYENLIYNDPTRQEFDPPLAFDSEDRVDRRITYCSTYDNRMNDDGSPNVKAVTRLSRLPASSANGFLPGGCTPVACVAEQVGAACAKDADCDSASGARDGFLGVGF